MRRELVLIFILFCVLCLGNIANLCRIYFPFGFDNQILTSWQFSATIGQLPYRDIFYPYGFLTYYKGTSFLWSITYLLIAPLLFTTYYFIFRQCFKKWYAILAITSLFIFVARFTSFEYFSRYGITPAFASILAIIIFGKANLSIRNTFFLGVMNGVIYFLYNDQGLYCLATFLILLALRFIAKFDRNLFFTRVKQLIKQVVTYLAGTFIVLLPFLLFLSSQNTLSGFLGSFSDLSNLEELAKTPYFHGFATVDNIFVLTALFVSVTYVLVQVYKNKKKNSTFYILIGLICALVICEQKSIVRLNDAQLSFYGVLLYVILFYEFLKKKKHAYLLFVISVAVILFLVPFRSLNWQTGPYSCKNRFEVLETRYTRVVKQLRKYNNFNGKVFSYPADAIFYVILKQNPPYYPTSFEASSRKAQQKLIDYISENEINYVVYNFKNTAVQDGVPNIIRTPYLNEYILKNYRYETRVGDFLILKKGKDEFLKNEKLPQEFKNYLRYINLENIPRSEGIYKSRFLKRKIVGGSVKEVNKFLIKNELSSNKKMIVIKSFSKSKKNILTIETDDGNKSFVEFNSCSEETVCIINLEHLPLFYSNRVLKSFLEDSNIREIGIFENTSRVFW